MELSVLIATAPTASPVNASMFAWLFTTFTVLIEKAGSCVLGTLPSAPKDATPLAIAITLLLIFAFNAFCVNVLIGLLISDVLSTLSKLKFVLKPATVELPVPPFVIATIPVTLVALPERLPINAPLTSLLTIALARFKLVAVANAFTAAATLSFDLPPTLMIKGEVALPPKSPANNILPFVVVVASATELVIDPEASANALAT